LTEGCTGTLAHFHEAEGLDILCHLMVELIELKLDSGRVGIWALYPDWQEGKCAWEL